MPPKAVKKRRKQRKKPVKKVRRKSKARSKPKTKRVSRSRSPKTSKPRKGKKELFCAPDREGDGLTCYSREDLLFLAEAYNRKRPNSKHIPLHLSKKDLWMSLQKRLSNECNTEWCWLEQDFVPAPYARKMLNETFRPEKPKEWNQNPFEWLTTVDIRKVMKQYEKKYPSFLFIGPVPVDCPTGITCALSGLDVNILVNRLGKTKLGVIFNLDPHNKPGSHWVAVYSDFLKGDIYYFDSVGIAPPKPIRRFLEKLKEGIERYHLTEFEQKKKVDILVNKTRFQYGSSECGVFGMYFIISNLEDRGVRTFKKKHVNDKRMNELRDVYFRS